MKSPAYNRFIKSMHIGFHEWHDGIPYDLEALEQFEPQELKEIERLLISRKNKDWRDTEALAKLGTTAAIAAIEKSLHGSNREVRLAAGEYLYSVGRLLDLSEIIVEALKNGTLRNGLGKAEHFATKYPSKQVEEALISGALHSSDGRAVRFAALLYYLHGVGKEPFDLNHQPLFLRFHTKNQDERRLAFEELCRIIGVDSRKWLDA